MLTRLYIDNFRSFVNFEYRPESKQLLFGVNGSGKSSLLEVVRYIKQFIKGGESPFTPSTRTRWQDRPLQIFEVEALLDSQRYEYRLEMRFIPDKREISVKSEILKVDGALMFELATEEIRFFPNDSLSPSTFKWETSESALHLSQFSNQKVRRFVEWIDTVHCFRIDSYPGTMEETADGEARQPDYELDNLAGWYRHAVSEYPEENLAFLKSMKDALSGFHNLRFTDDEAGVRKLRAVFTSPAKERVNYSISELSEGQRCLIALYMILHFLVARGQTVFIDEPDNFIALREIQPWLLAAEQAVENHGGQLVLISHHPEILNQWASEYGLRFFREDNGHVRTEKFKVDPNGNLRPSELIARGWELV